MLSMMGLCCAASVSIHCLISNLQTLYSWHVTAGIYSTTIFWLEAPNPFSNPGLNNTAFNLHIAQALAHIDSLEMVTNKLPNVMLFIIKWHK